MPNGHLKKRRPLFFSVRAVMTVHGPPPQGHSIVGSSLAGALVQSRAQCPTCPHLWHVPVLRAGDWASAGSPCDRSMTGAGARPSSRRSWGGAWHGCEWRRDRGRTEEEEQESGSRSATAGGMARDAAAAGARRERWRHLVLLARAHVLVEAGCHRRGRWQWRPCGRGRSIFGLLGRRRPLAILLVKSCLGLRVKSVVLLEVISVDRGAMAHRDAGTRAAASTPPSSRPSAEGQWVVLLPS